MKIRIILSWVIIIIAPVLWWVIWHFIATKYHAEDNVGLSMAILLSCVANMVAAYKIIIQFEQ